MLRHLARDEEDLVRAAAAKNPTATADTLRELADIGGDGVLEAVAAHPNTAAGLISDLGYRFCVHRETCDDNCRWGGEDFAAVVAAAVINPSRPGSLAEDLDVHFDNDDIEGVAGLATAETDPQRLAVWARSPDEEIRSSVAANPHTPSEVLETLIADGGWDVATAAGRNPSTPPAALESLARLGVYAALTNPNYPPEALTSLEGVADNNRTAITENPSAPPEVLAGLVDHMIADIRAAAVSHPSCPQTAVREASLLASGDPTLIAILAETGIYCVDVPAFQTRGDPSLLAALAARTLRLGR